MSAFLTGTRGDVALLILLCRAQAGLTSILGLRATAGPLPAADSPAAVSAALGPGAPRRPAAVHRVAGHPPKTKNFSCWAAESTACHGCNIVLTLSFLSSSKRANYSKATLSSRS